MKVLLINGSPHAKGNTAVALEEMVKVFQEEGIETDILHIGNKAIRGCIACRQCAKLGNISICRFAGAKIDQIFDIPKFFD